MSFNLEITFTGICGFVSNSDPDLKKVPRVCVVMPSTDVGRNAIDGEPLCPHECYIEQGYGFALTKTSLKGKRLKFQFDSEPITLPMAMHDVPGLIEVSKSGNNPGNVDPSVVSNKIPPLGYVMSQVWINAGTPDVKTASKSHWVIDPNDTAGVLVAHELRFTLASLTKASALLSPFDESQVVNIDLTPSTGVSTVALRIVNTCARGTSFQYDAYRDRDFKWYHELMDPNTVSLDPSRDLNIPRSLRDFIGGNNCFPAFLGSVPMG
jgi:hypothetical protein